MSDMIVKRHSLAHIMAKVVKDMFPNALLGIGPAIEDGFYYDFFIQPGFNENVLVNIELKMRSVIEQKVIFERMIMDIDMARSALEERKETFKLELLDDLAKAGEKEVVFYNVADFMDLCKGPHVHDTSELKTCGFKLDRVAGAYWKGDAKQPMMSRIYGLAFETDAELKEYVEKREIALQNDHRVLGKRLKYFVFSDLVGKGLPLLLPNGTTVRRELERFIVDEELKRGYQHVCSSVLGKEKLYEISGHLAHYKDDMYPAIEIEGERYILRPMTCPHQFMMYNSERRSYKDLPIRLAEISTMYRREKSGELYGLMRLMGFTLADAHIFCTFDQVASEFKAVVELINYVMEVLHLKEKCYFRASLRDRESGKYVENSQQWEIAEQNLLNILDELGLKYEVSKGAAAFYGPKLDIQMRTVHGKEETIITNQIDMMLAKRFNLTYIDKDGSEQYPVILHRSSVGCLERTIGFLLENTGGRMPLWLAPVQIKILPINEDVFAYAQDVVGKLRANLFRVDIDLRNETLGKKLREAILELIPYIVILGKGELEKQQLTVRNRDTKVQNSYTFEEFVSRLSNERSCRAYKLGL